MRKNIFWLVFCFLVGMAGGIFAEQIFWPYFVERPLFYEYNLERPPVYLTEKREIRIQENQALQEAVEKVAKSVIGIRTVTSGGKVIEGSGLIVTSDGLVITLARLVPQGARFSFFVEGKVLPYQVLKRKEDLALIKLESTEPLSTLGFADLEKKALGERVFLVGQVFGEEKPQKVVNEGLIRGLGEDLIETNIFESKALQGSSLFDIEGNFLGLNLVSSSGRILAIPNLQIKSFIGF